MPLRVQHRVFRAVEAVARIVGHAAVGDDVALEARDPLDAADRVDGHARVGDDAAARLQQEARLRQGARGERFPQTDGHFADAGRDIRARVAVDVAHAVAAAEIQLLKGEAQLVTHLGHEVDHQIDRAQIHVLVEDHRADVAVQTGELQLRHAERGAYEFHGLAGLDRHAELHVHRAGVDSLVGVRVDARGDAQQDLLPQAARLGRLAQGDQLVTVVHDEAAHAAIERESDVPVRLAVAVVIDVLRREARRERRGDLAGGDRVDAEALLGHDAVHPLEGGGLARVERQRVRAEARAHGLAVHPAVLADAVLVHQIQRRAVAVRQITDRLPGKAQRSVRVSADIVTEHGDPSLSK